MLPVAFVAPLFPALFCYFDPPKWLSFSFASLVGALSHAARFVRPVGSTGAEGPRQHACNSQPGPAGCPTRASSSHGWLTIIGTPTPVFPRKNGKYMTYREPVSM